MNKCEHFTSSEEKFKSQNYKELFYLSALVVGFCFTLLVLLFVFNGHWQFTMYKGGKGLSWLGKVFVQLNSNYDRKAGLVYKAACDQTWWL